MGTTPVAVRLVRDLLLQVDAAAKAHGVTRSAWLRQLIADGQAGKNAVAFYDVTVPPSRPSRFIPYSYQGPRARPVSPTDKTGSTLRCHVVWRGPFDELCEGARLMIFCQKLLPHESSSRCVGPHLGVYKDRIVYWTDSLGTLFYLDGTPARRQDEEVASPNVDTDTVPDDAFHDGDVCP